MPAALLAEPGALPRGLWLTLALLVAAASAAAGLRALRAPLARPFGQLALVLALGAAGVAAWTALDPLRDPSLALAVAALSAGLAHAAVFRFLPQRALGGVSRRVAVRVGTWTGFLAAMALVRPAWPFVVLASGGGLWALLLWLGALARHAPAEGEGASSVRFPCPRCGTLGDWPEGVTPCSDCGLFVHLYDEPEGLAEPARLASDETPAAELVRFTCPSCGHAGDWRRGHAACAHCGHRLRLHWNEHATDA